MSGWRTHCVAIFSYSYWAGQHAQLFVAEKGWLAHCSGQFGQEAGLVWLDSEAGAEQVWAQQGCEQLGTSEWDLVLVIPDI